MAVWLVLALLILLDAAAWLGTTPAMGGTGHREERAGRCGTLAAW